MRTRVAAPALSRLQNEPKRYRDFYLKAINLIAKMVLNVYAAGQQLGLNL